MNDPHVVALIYRVDHGKQYDYSKAKRRHFKAAEFLLEIEDEWVRFKFKTHYATEDEARNAIDNYISAWEFDACLKGGENYFRLRFDKSEIVDRSPTPGATVAHATPVRFKFSVISTAEVIVGVPEYPLPPSDIALNPDVETMYTRYMGYRRGNEPLASMAYFCLTVLEHSTSLEGKGEHAADRKYQIGKSVLKKIRVLSSRKGGQFARKGDAVTNDFTSQERTFLEQAIQRIIRRAAEKAHSPDKVLPKISLSDLPQI